MKNSKHSFRIGAAERKSLIILCYYILLGVVAFSAFTVSTRSSTLFANTIAEYWRCESAGLNSENSCDGLRDLLRQLGNPGLTSASYILLGIFPAVNLIFAVNVKEIKQKFRTWCGRAATFHPSEERSTASQLPTQTRSSHGI